MSLLKSTLEMIVPTNKEIVALTQQRLDNLTKPQGSLGKLEDLTKQLAAIRSQAIPGKLKKTIVNMAGDHGVVAEGVSAFPQEVTPQMVLNFVNGGAAINVLSRQAEAELVLVDMGVAIDLPSHEKIINKKVAYGTKNFCVESAMTIEQAIQALEAGISIANECAEKGTNIIGLGEMGIGNTTPSTAILAVYSGLEISTITGRGTGINDQGVLLKISAIERGIALNNPDPSDALDVLAKVGGFEIAGLAGLIIGAASKKIPIIIDGFISCAAAIIAVNLNPVIKEYLIASHLSVEPGHQAMLNYLGLEPMLMMNMRLGEGTGSALAMLLIDASINILNEMATFTEAGISGAE